MDCQATSFVSVTQCDPTSGIDPICWPATVTDDVSCAAKRLATQERQDLAIQVLAGTETVSELARQHEVSRKFLYQQVDTAKQALSQTFAPPPTPSDKVLFYLPVTKAWLRQLVLEKQLVSVLFSTKHN
jgi:transposase-like protein